MYYLSLLIYIYLELNQFVNHQDKTSSNAMARFNYLNVYPSAPREGQPIYLNANIKNPGNVSKWYLKWKIKFGFVVMMAGMTELCGFNPVTLPNGMGTVQIKDWNCPTDPGNVNFQALAHFSRVPRCVDKVDVELRVQDENHKELLGLDFEFIKDKNEVLKLNANCENKKLIEIIDDQINDNNHVQNFKAKQNNCLNRIIFKGNLCQEICKTSSTKIKDTLSGCIEKGQNIISKSSAISDQKLITQEKDLD